MVVCIGHHHASHYKDWMVYCGYYITKSVYTVWFHILISFGVPIGYDCSWFHFDVIIVQLLYERKYVQAFCLVG
jgi:hypothetical protein